MASRSGESAVRVVQLQLGVNEVFYLKGARASIVLGVKLKQTWASAKDGLKIVLLSLTR